ncbi:unnamed protein product [Adineta ricciae]|uniref:Uncharacterized protein n=1 Tax=Adineta ricciae TaxID=249248 RepID=A0A815JB15_ADIRI|nr:unnamed protein product [Adineta ricciae]CAF1568455.1 unnamed protein product [Adineta ricciae]
MERVTSIDPYEILDVNPGAFYQDIRHAFIRKISSPSRSQRASVALAYEVLCSNDTKRYTRNGNRFTVNIKDQFYYVTIGDYESFVRLITRHKHLLDQRDEHLRTLLYIAARNGFHNICQFLLRVGCQINETQHCGSTALHAAAYYRHQPIVELLLEYGAHPTIRNGYGHTAEEESGSEAIRTCILSHTVDKINRMVNRLKQDGHAKNMIVLRHNDRIIGKKILRSPDYLSNHSLAYLTQNWTLAWHGTKYEHLQSIMKYGLHPAGTVLSPNNKISTQAGHIALNKKVGEFDNWAHAVFISPSIFYAADIVYSERIFSDNQRWCVLVEVRVKPGSFTKHKQTLLNQRLLLPGEPQDIEYRVAVTADNDFILRVESNENVIVTALVFINLNFLENIDEYYQGENLFANSEAERTLFQ